MRPPSGTLWSGANNTTSPSASGKPSVSTSDMNFPICRGGTLTTAATWRPTSASGLECLTTCALDRLRPTKGPKSMTSFSAGLRASGNGSAATIVPTRMSTARNRSNVMASPGGCSNECEICMKPSDLFGVRRHHCRRIQRPRLLLFRRRPVRSLLSPGDQPSAALIAGVNPQPVEDNAQPIAQADQKVDVREAPNPPRRGAAELETAEVDYGEPLADRGQAARMSVAEGMGRRVAVQAAFDDPGDVTPLLFCGGRYAGDRVSIGARDRHRVADGEDFRPSRNREIRKNHDSAGAVGWRAEPFGRR